MNQYLHFIDFTVLIQMVNMLKVNFACFLLRDCEILGATRDKQSVLLLFVCDFDRQF